MVCNCMKLYNEIKNPEENIFSGFYFALLLVDIFGQEFEIFLTKAPYHLKILSGNYVLPPCSY